MLFHSLAVLPYPTKRRYRMVAGVRNSWHQAHWGAPSAKRSATMSRAPASASSTSGTSCRTKGSAAWSACTLWGCLQMSRASGSRPLSRAMLARVLRFFLVGQVQIFERDQSAAGEELVSQRSGERVLFLEAAQDRGTTIRETLEAQRGLRDLSDLHLVEPTGRLFAIARDERDRGRSRRGQLGTNPPSDAFLPSFSPRGFGRGGGLALHRQRRRQDRHHNGSRP